MVDIRSFLIDWIIRFLENKDAISKSIMSIKKQKGSSDFIVNYKNKVKYFIVKTVLENNILDIIKENENFGIVTLNNSSNINLVISNWKKLIDFKLLSIYFVNPLSNLDKSWILSPYVHNKICDNVSLELGLTSMSEMVDPIDVNELQKKIKSKREEFAR